MSEGKDITAWVLGIGAIVGFLLFPVLGVLIFAAFIRWRFRHIFRWYYFLVLAAFLCFMVFATQVGILRH